MGRLKYSHAFSVFVVPPIKSMDYSPIYAGLVKINLSISLTILRSDTPLINNTILNSAGPLFHARSRMLICCRVTFRSGYKSKLASLKKIRSVYLSPSGSH